MNAIIFNNEFSKDLYDRTGGAPGGSPNQYYDTDLPWFTSDRDAIDNFKLNIGLLYPAMIPLFAGKEEVFKVQIDQNAMGLVSLLNMVPKDFYYTLKRVPQSSRMLPIVDMTYYILVSSFCFNGKPTDPVNPRQEISLLTSMQAVFYYL